MGQYHYTCNIDKKEYINPHRFGDGLKLLEFGSSGAGTMTALACLLAEQNKDGARGGGDLRIDEDNEAGSLVGSWAGDRIAVFGDYGEIETDPVWAKDNPWVNPEGWTDISDRALAMIRMDGYIDSEHTQREDRRVAMGWR